MLRDKNREKNRGAVLRKDIREVRIGEVLKEESREENRGAVLREDISGGRILGRRIEKQC